MSRTNGSGNGGGSRSGGGAHARGRDATTGEPGALAAFLRDLADRAERDPALAAHLREALGMSGLLDAAGHPRHSAESDGKRAPASGRRATRTTRADADGVPDPFVVLREHGEVGLRTALEELDLAALRAIVRSHRLDPARISARWTARERVIGLIVTQVCGRANLGKAFSHV